MKGRVNNPPVSGSSGITPNGIIESYVIETDGAAISAGDFVSFVNNRRIAAKTFGNYGNLHTIAISSTSFLMVWNNNSNSKYTTAAVYTIDGSGIFTQCTPLVIKAVAATSGCSTCICYLSAGKYIVLYGTTTGIVLNIDGSNIITKGTENTGLTNTGSIYKSMCPISSTKVIAHCDSTKALVLNIDGSDNITAGTPTTVYGDFSNCLAKISDTKFLAVSWKSAGGTTRAVVLIEDGAGGITKGTELNLNTIAYTSELALVSLSSTKFVLSYSGLTPYYKKLVVLTVNAATNVITYGTPLTWYAINKSVYMRLSPINSSSCAFFYETFETVNSVDLYYKKLAILNIDGSDIITIASDCEIVEEHYRHDGCISLITLDSTNFVYTHSNNNSSFYVGETGLVNYNNGILQTLGTKNKVIKAKYVCKIGGIAKTAGTSTQSIDVYNLAT